MSEYDELAMNRPKSLRGSCVLILMASVPSCGFFAADTSKPCYPELEVGSEFHLTVLERYDRNSTIVPPPHNELRGRPCSPQLAFAPGDTITVEITGLTPTGPPPPEGMGCRTPNGRVNQISLQGEVISAKSTNRDRAAVPRDSTWMTVEHIELASGCSGELQVGFTGVSHLASVARVFLYDDPVLCGEEAGISACADYYVITPGLVILPDASVAASTSGLPPADASAVE